MGKDDLTNPFSKEIMRAPLPDGFKLPHTIPTYDGTTDPQLHLHAFWAYFDILYRVPDPIMCRAFPVFLSETALTWFSKLPPRSVNDFSDLESKFLLFFSTRRAVPKDPVVLFNLRQGRNESLRDYLDRFNREALCVRNSSERIELHALRVGLRAGEFSRSLLMKPPVDMKEFRSRSMEYINMEECNKEYFNDKRERDERDEDDYY